MAIDDTALRKSWLNTVTWFLLVIGTWIAFGLVLLGGIGSLYQFGNMIIQPSAIPSTHYTTTTLHHWHAVFSSLPHSMIEAGLLLLVVIQVLRVGFLCLYFILQKDKWFIAISGFILVMLIYSLLWQLF